MRADLMLLNTPANHNPQQGKHRHSSCIDQLLPHDVVRNKLEEYVTRQKCTHKGKCILISLVFN